MDKAITKRIIKRIYNNPEYGSQIIRVSKTKNSVN